MNVVFNVIIGVLCVAYGSYTLWARHVHPERFGKLDAMKQFWGPLAGYVIHVVGYSVAPIVFGIALIIAGLLGAPLFGLD